MGEQGWDLNERYPKGGAGGRRGPLSPLLEENKRMSQERVNGFVKGRSPKYLPILSRISAEKLNIDPEISDKDLDVLLHRCLSDIESQLMEEGHDIMTPKGVEDPEDYRKRLDNYLGMVEDIKKSDLASYVSHRKVILDLLEKAIERTPSGGYCREDLIHRLIMPMGVDSREIDQIQSRISGSWMSAWRSMNIWLRTRRSDRCQSRVRNQPKSLISSP